MSRAREFVLPAYILLCLVLGGSAQAIWGNALLQILGVALICWALASPQSGEGTPGQRGLVGLALAGVALMLIQILPLPPSVWSALPGRDFVAAGYAELGEPLPWLPLSLAPFDTLAAAMTLLPPLAVLAVMLRRRDWRAESLAAAIAAAAAFGVLLGMLQVSIGGERWYFYRITNLGMPTGMFANANHHVTLMLSALPLLAALAAGQRAAGGRKPSLGLLASGAAASLLLVGLATAGSVTVLLLGPPVVAASLLLLVRPNPRLLKVALGGIVGLILAAGLLIGLAGDRLPTLGSGASIATRSEYWAQTVTVIRSHLPSGTGFGTFEAMYQRSLDPALASRFFVNHAHNDYLELVLEGGLAAAALLLAFLAWWTVRALSAWLGERANSMQRAAAVASAAILLHSVLDYPLRTEGMMAVMAFCLAILAGARGRLLQGEDEAERARHATL